jgi:pimeloyl-ACP methyl ester carboxylesterase
VNFETYGTLSAARDNAILVCHSLTSRAHAAGRHAPDDQQPGWWDAAIGPGKMLDTKRYFVISTDALGAGQSTGPASPDPETGRRYGVRFPVITVRDMVRAQHRLVQRLGIDRLHAVIGGCMGGQQAVEWAIAYPAMVGNAVVITTTPATSAHTIDCVAHRNPRRPQRQLRARGRAGGGWSRRGHRGSLWDEPRGPPEAVHRRSSVHQAGVEVESFIASHAQAHDMTEWPDGPHARSGCRPREGAYNDPRPSGRGPPAVSYGCSRTGGIRPRRSGCGAMTAAGGDAGTSCWTSAMVTAPPQRRDLAARVSGFLGAPVR